MYLFIYYLFIISIYYLIFGNYINEDVLVNLE